MLSRKASHGGVNAWSGASLLHWTRKANVWISYAWLGFISSQQNVSTLLLASYFPLAERTHDYDPCGVAYRQILA
ncbi:hypothetical protein V6N12_001783 [Hibiscus sabdariffa]|uniref:Uncharacterized protein n=1 Tax=Hibiscus sabdariffa TaxID=183260 RepID=A0ABR2BRC2_9ROSI